ncbi:conserved protein, unknown function [Hepatocystis sp. ex Piliocolobus tephrosceles]|nr:conserved protein, unknown function [Hepatocystis sp. ex Piliocolobus tephrosceles]
MNELSDNNKKVLKRKKMDSSGPVFSPTEEDKNVNKMKRNITFENDKDFEIYLLKNFKKNNENEYMFSNMLKNLHHELKKYKTINDMADEIKRVAIESIHKNLEIICNNECTSSFFIEKYRVKYINEQNELNIKSAQNYFKEFLILYKKSNFENFSLEINTNIEEKKEGTMISGIDEYEEKNNDNKNDKEENKKKKIIENINDKKEEFVVDNNSSLTNVLTKENMYKSNIWKDIIKCKIENINDNNNIILKIINYFSSISLHIDNIPININKFDIFKKLNELNYDVLNLNIWDTYNKKENKLPFLSQSASNLFYRKGNIYFKKQNKVTELLNRSRTRFNYININDWHLSNNVKRINYNFIDLKICPPICSHMERIKEDYEYAKILVSKLDSACDINFDLLQKIEEETYLQFKTKKRKLAEDHINNNTITTMDVDNNNISLETNNVKDDINDNKKDTVNEYNKININTEHVGSPIIYIIEENINNNDIKKKLDILILYLRFVHNFCYYSAKKYNTYDEMVRECKYFYLRVNLNLEKKIYNNSLLPKAYENYNIKELDFFLDDNFFNINGNVMTDIVKEEKGNVNDEDEKSGHSYKKDFENLSKLKNKYFNKEDDISICQLKWLYNFNKEIKEAIKSNYYEYIDIEKTNEFLQILENNYILKSNAATTATTTTATATTATATTTTATSATTTTTTTNNTSNNNVTKNEIRCAKCKKLFNNIKDVPNHIFMKHSQIKIKLITEVEVEIMQKYFYESPHSFNLFFMMEKKYNSAYRKNTLNNTFFNKGKIYKNQNFHLVTDYDKNDYKDFDDPNLNVLEDVKHEENKKNDFYDDT